MMRRAPFNETAFSALPSNRFLELRQQNLFDATGNVVRCVCVCVCAWIAWAQGEDDFVRADAFEADIVVMETHFPIGLLLVARTRERKKRPFSLPSPLTGIRKALCKFLQNLKPGARLLSYDDWEQVGSRSLLPGEMPHKHIYMVPMKCATGVRRGGYAVHFRAPPLQ
jgi:hypothetical protein